VTQEKKPLCREVPYLEGIIKMSKQEVAHELRRMQSRMLNFNLEGPPISEDIAWVVNNRYAGHITFETH
jgi:hypothetical protein